ncbi:hypothetical protein [Jiella pacifica]|uniref:HEAT repeat domain-containing protein n=1 Tax=Jiella pacifica TaxID=2696469 RepID=A0A6N9T5E1_9HYPH|nr:hypothetical protein [Jiella pacifica]NDW04158.1 hypothetical protein [Jiella pacifica]
MNVLNALAVAGFLVGAMLTAHPAGAVTFEDLEAHMDRSQAELAKFRSALADDNPDRRRAAMEFLLKSDDPVLVRLAKEAGLNSPDIQIQKAALRAIFDRNPRLRVQVQMDGPETEHLIGWIEGSLEGSVEGKTAFFYLLVGEYNSQLECWSPYKQKGCLIYLADNTATLEVRNAKIPLKLNENGLMTGLVLYEWSEHRANLKSMIDLME